MVDTVVFSDQVEKKIAVVDGIVIRLYHSPESDYELKSSRGSCV